MKLLAAKALKDKIFSDLSDKAKDFLKNNGRPPGLGVLLLGADPASEVYVGHKVKACDQLGFFSKKIQLPESSSVEEVKVAIKDLNQDDNIDGFIIQLPLPKHLPESELLDMVVASKDSDCLGATNFGRSQQMCSKVHPCTPSGVIELLKHYDIEMEGKKATVIGRSNIVGKPMAQLLVNENATVTICHSRTKNLSEITSTSDIVVVAAGQPHFFGAEYFSESACVVDVGIHRLSSGKLCGDVKFDEVSSKVAAITPVPGGVGPLTIAMLLKNTYELACLRPEKK